MKESVIISGPDFLLNKQAEQDTHFKLVYKHIFIFFQRIFSGTLSMSNGLGPDQDRQF